VIRPEPASPGRIEGGQALPQGRAPVEFDPVALAVIEAERLYMREAIERPGEAGRRILAAGEQHQRTGLTARHGRVLRHGQSPSYSAQE